MSTAFPGQRHGAATPPRWPALVLVAFCVLATLSLAQGIVDVVLPVSRGEQAFGFLFSMTERHGPSFFVAYIFLHNLGLACLVPGFGFVAAYYEKKTVNRGLIGLLLTGAVVMSLLVAIHFIVSAPDRFDLPLASALLVGEACGVLALAVAAAAQLRGFVPTRRYEWSLVTPFRQLGIPFAYSAILLLLMSLFEAWAVLGL